MKKNYENAKTMLDIQCLNYKDQRLNEMPEEI